MSEISFLGTGWSFPPSFEKGNYQVNLSSGENNIGQSIDLIFQTPKGSRNLIPFFGSELKSFMFMNADSTLREEIEQSVKATLLNDEPRINVDKVDVSYVSGNTSIVTISINYTIKNTNTRHNHVFPFSILEGTNLQASG